ncbi:MAG: glycosyltransferase [Candidatus Coatesbacteria bacterium]
MNLLYLAAFVPHPVTDGDKVRAFWTLRALARRHRVHAFFLDPEGQGRIPGPVGALCADVRVFTFPRSMRASGALLGALQGLPVHSYAFWNRSAQAELDRVVARWRPSACHVHRIRMMPYAERLGLPYVLDATDSIAAYYRRSASLRGWRRAYARFDARRVEVAERRWGNAAKAVLAITREERANLVRLGIRSPVCVAPNGIDLVHWRMSRSRRVPGLLAFVGNLGYPPNVKGLEWFALRIAPMIAARVPGARLVVAGGGLTPALRASVSRSPMPIRFAGFVQDLRPFLGSASAVVCPLPLAAGLQNKAVLAMACGAPVVATSNVARAIGARSGHEAAVADSPAGFASATVGLLASRGQGRRLALGARRLIERRFGDDAARVGIDRAFALLARAVEGR